tara:strand:- start:1544 stop:2683 length:1140 start_codon:yes stop_codon:yes gene_type:complete
MASAPMAILSAHADALAATNPTIPREQLLQIAAQCLGSQASAPPTRKRTIKQIESGCRCCARVWGSGSGNDQCNKKRIPGSDYCKAHAAKVAAHGKQPCQLDDSGKRIGLFTGDIREPLPSKDSTGLWVITWNNPEAQSQMEKEKAAGTFQWHPWAPNSGSKAVAKKASAPRKPRAPKAPKAPKTAQTVPKKPRGKSSFLCYLGQHRAEIKQRLTDENPGTKISVGAVSKEAGKMWKALSAESKKPYEEMSKADLAQKMAQFQTQSIASVPATIAPVQAPATPPPTPNITVPAQLSQLLQDDDQEEVGSGEEEEDGEEMDMAEWTNPQDGKDYIICELDGGKKWVISQEQGEDADVDPEDFIQLGSWTGDLEDPQVTLH